MDEDVKNNLVWLGMAVFSLIVGIILVFYTKEFREYDRKLSGTSKIKLDWINSRSYIPAWRFGGLIFLGMFILAIYSLFTKSQN
jgi:hypothetical protein